MLLKQRLPKQYKKYQNLLTDFDKLYGKFEPYAVKRSNFIEIFYRNSELMQTMFRLYQFEQRVEKEKLKYDESLKQTPTSVRLKEIHDTDAYKKAKQYIVSQITRIQKNYNVNVDRGVFEAIMPLYDAKNSNSDFYRSSSFTNLTNALKALEGTSDEVISAINNDAAYKYAKPYIAEFYNDLEPNDQRLYGEIAKVQIQ